MKKPVYQTPYLSASREAFRDGAISGVRKLTRGVRSDDLTDVELLGICSVADPTLLTLETLTDKPPADASANPLLGSIVQEHGTLGAEYLQISTARPIEAVFSQDKVTLRVG